MPISIHRVVDLTGEQVAAIGTLSIAVYSPETTAHWPGRSMEWASAEWCVVSWDESGQALSHVGIVLREGKVNDGPVKIGGVGSIKTHPNARRRGLAAKAIGRALEFFAEQDVDFALLVCEPELVPLYERLGWRLYPDPLFVTQHGQKSRFTFNLPMIHPVGTNGPTAGVIDLLGPPW